MGRIIAIITVIAPVLFRNSVTRRVVTCTTAVNTGLKDRFSYVKVMIRLMFRHIVMMVRFRIRIIFTIRDPILKCLVSIFYLSLNNLALTLGHIWFVRSALEERFHRSRGLLDRVHIYSPTDKTGKTGNLTNDN